MCIPPKTPKAPEVPMPAQRQAVRMPERSTTGTTADDRARRRRAMASTVMTSPLGLPTTPTTTSKLGA